MVFEDYNAKHWNPKSWNPQNCLSYWGTLRITGVEITVLGKSCCPSNVERQGAVSDWEHQLLLGCGVRSVQSAVHALCVSILRLWLSRGSFCSTVLSCWLGVFFLQFAVLCIASLRHFQGWTHKSCEVTCRILICLFPNTFVFVNLTSWQYIFIMLTLCASSVCIKSVGASSANKRCPVCHLPLWKRNILSSRCLGPIAGFIGSHEHSLSVLVFQIDVVIKLVHSHRWHGMFHTSLSIGLSYSQLLCSQVTITAVRECLCTQNCVC